MAIARLLYERSQFDKAIEVYSSIPRQSKYFPEALEEQAWTFIKAKEWQKAYRALDLLLLSNPETPDAPDLRLTMGNLNLRMENFFLANDTFGKVRDEFEPVHRQLQQVIVKAEADPTYFDTLVGKNLDKFDIASFVPPSAATWVRAEPEVQRMAMLAGNVGEMQKDLEESQKLVDRIDRVVKGGGRAGIFPDLASARTKSVEMLNLSVNIRQKLAGKMRALLEPTLTDEERKKLDALAMQRDGLERQLVNAPTTDAAAKDRDATMRSGFGGLAQELSDMNVEIQSLDAQVVAIESYYRSSRAEQKIRPEDIQGPLRDLRGAVDELHSSHDQIREEIDDASHDATTAGTAGAAEHEAEERLNELLRQESEVQDAAKLRLASNDRVEADKIGGLMARCDFDPVEAQRVRQEGRRPGRCPPPNRAAIPRLREGRAHARGRQAGRHHRRLEDAGGRARAGDVHEGRRQVLRPSWSSPTSASSTPPGASRTRRRPPSPSSPTRRTSR